MTHGENLNMTNAVELFYYPDDVSIDLVMQMMDNKSEMDRTVEETKKQLKKVSETLKPAELAGLEKDLKALLDAGKLIDDVEVRTLMLRIKLVKDKWQERYAEAENNILSKSANVILKKITKADLDLLRKARRELAETEKDKKREVITTNIFKSSDFAALRPLISFEQK